MTGGKKKEAPVGANDAGLEKSYSSNNILHDSEIVNHAKPEFAAMERLTERAVVTIRTVFLALPELMKQVDEAFLIRFGTGSLTAADRVALAEVQKAADEIQAELVEKAAARHEASGHDEKTARRLAVAEFCTLYCCALDFALKVEGGRA